MNLIDKILKDLEPFKDKILISPLSVGEVDLIQSKFNKKLPEYFKEFLLKIGLKQDLIWGINEGVNRFQDLREFLESEDYFRFGDNGGEDYWLLKFEDENNRMIYELDHYNSMEIRSLNKTFDDLLVAGIEEIKKKYDDLDSNEIKDWCVQFSVETGSGKFLEKELGKYLTVKLINKPVFVEESSAGVKCYEGEIEIEGQIKKLKEQSYEGWSNSSLYFNWQESVKQMQENSLIKKIDGALSNCVFKHTLIDYGILNRDELQDIETEKQLTTTRGN
ncbi:MAG: SMI1/KNR4 family protein [Bacteroidales bacterium]|jgi:hypothetical protein|nr:SMI1/KNR4 family protein [Bacteroidales bacterium]